MNQTCNGDLLRPHESDRGIAAGICRAGTIGVWGNWAAMKLPVADQLPVFSLYHCGSWLPLWESLAGSRLPKQFENETGCGEVFAMCVGMTGVE